MSDKKLCKLCQAGLALEIDLEKSRYKSANSLLQRLFDCYNIDISVLGEGPCTCKQCFEGILQISKQLEKWSNAQKVLQKTSLLDIDNAVVSVKEEPKTLLWDHNDDAEFTSAGSLGLFKNETPNSDDPEFLDEDEPTEDLEFLDEDVPQAEDMTFLDEEEPQQEEVEPLAVEPSKNQAEEVSAEVYEELFGIEQIQEKSTDHLDWRLTSHDFFCVCFSRVVQRQNFTVEHSDAVHLLQSEYWCRSCGIYFPNITELKFHEKYQKHQLVTSPLAIMCLKCDRISTQFTNAIRHENTFHDKIFKCKKCSVSFHSRESFAKHQWKDRNHECLYPNCRRKYKLWQRYISHLHWHRSHVSRCPVKVCPIIMMPGDHVKHLRTHSKQYEVIF